MHVAHTQLIRPPVTNLLKQDKINCSIIYEEYNVCYPHNIGASYSRKMLFIWIIYHGIISILKIHPVNFLVKLNYKTKKKFLSKISTIFLTKKFFVLNFSQSTWKYLFYEWMTPNKKHKFFNQDQFDNTDTCWNIWRKIFVSVSFYMMVRISPTSVEHQRMGFFHPLV